MAAATALTATNALALGGNAPSFYANIGANTFTGAQTMPSLTVMGPVVEGSLTIGGGNQITEYVSVTQTITLPGIVPAACATLTTSALTGFSPGVSDTIALGLPAGLVTGLGSGVFLSYQAWETTTAPSPTITIQVCNTTGKNYKGGNTGSVRIDVFKH